MVGRTTLRRAAGAALAAGLLTLGGAANASAVVPGGLVSKSCVASTVISPCAQIANLGNSTQVITSPNGGQVYALTTLGAVYTLLTFSRDVGSGQLTLKDCIHSTAAGGGCRALPPAAMNLNNPTAMAITDRSLYVANAGTNTILEFDRAGDGTLNLKSAPCIANAGGPPPASPCLDAQAMNGPQDLAVGGDQL